MERMWGGRRLNSEFRKKLPPHTRIGESWEIVDRLEAQSTVANRPLKGKTLHELWTRNRHDIFGDVSETPRFPLLIKLLDAQERLSLQVHPPEEVAVRLGGEPKTEFWYVAAAGPGAELFLGFCEPITRAQFKRALDKGTVEDCVQKIRAKAGDAMFLPAGRLHAVGGGNLLVEIQQNSDTTYRVFDWNRTDAGGKLRQLHIDQALQCIDFTDVGPRMIEPKGEVLIKHELFEVEKWNLDSSREIAPLGQFAIVCCVTGSLRCASVDLVAGEFFLVPASLEIRQLRPQSERTSLLRITIPNF